MIRRIAIPGLFLLAVIAVLLIFHLLPTRTVLDIDQEFVNGSRIEFTQLSELQIRNLTTFGKIWGFLKYHHPAVTAGRAHWDFELFRVLPAVLAANDVGTFRRTVVEWIARLGEIPACHPCAGLSQQDLQLQPRLEWLGDEARLGQDLSRILLAVYRGRVPGQQFYVDPVWNIGNPSFGRELAYPDIKLPDAGFQLLALYRFWNIIEYWFPYRDLIGEDWDAVLSRSIPKISLANSKVDYQQQLFILVAAAHDSHANLWRSFKVLPPVGDCQVPAGVRFVADEAVVTGYAAETREQAGLQRGDVLLSIDGAAVSRLLSDWSSYYAASNEAARQDDIARFMLRGACGAVDLHVRRGSRLMHLSVARVPIAATDFIELYRDDLPGEAFQLLSGRVAYLKLSAVKADEAASYIERANGTDGLIIDIRNYPAEYVVYALGSLLVDRKVEFVRFTRADFSNPGAFHWLSPESLSPRNPRYKGKVVIIVNEVSMSQAEYTAMAFRVAPNAVVVGSTTTGADGDASEFFLPGGIHAMITGRGCFYPDKRPTQRVGIIPDVFVKPTVAGIRAGRDEVLEAALRQIVGNGVPEAELEAMYPLKRPIDQD